MYLAVGKLTLYLGIPMTRKCHGPLDFGTLRLEKPSQDEHAVSSKSCQINSRLLSFGKVIKP